jgi:hypothetical protein
MNKYILVMKPANDYSATLDYAVTTVCENDEEVVGTILGFLDSDAAEDVDPEMDVEEAQKIIEETLTEFNEEINQIVIILGDNDDEGLEGMEILIKLI